METPDCEVVRAAAAWTESGAAITLITVARTWGSAPRPPGALMAVHPDGRFVGSISGGCVEEDLLEHLNSGELEVSAPTLRTYGLRRDEAERFGLPCGGRLELLLERLDGSAGLGWLARQMEQRRLIGRRVRLGGGCARYRPASRDQEFSYDGNELVKVFGPRWRLLLIGAGQAARYVAEMAIPLGFEVIVCEPRGEQAALWPVPETVLERAMPDDAVLSWATDPRSGVITLTHDPRLDDLALMEALLSDAFYVGALGSAASSRKRRQRLLQLGLPRAAVAKLHAPLGFPIGSRTPAEIAVSAMAQVVAERNRPGADGRVTSCARDDLEIRQ